MNRVLLTGDFLHPDFAGVRGFLAVAEAIDLKECTLSSGWSDACDIIAVCQSRPGQVTQDEIEQLHSRSPLASLLAILGSWCEGELRSGHPWHGVDRVYWYDAVGRLLWLLNSGGNALALRTYTAAERIERGAVRCPASAPAMPAAIFVQRRYDYEPLADICRMLGLSPRWERSWQAFGPAPTLLLAALDDLQANPSIESLAVLASAWPEAKRIALLNFPRRNEVEQLREAGFHHVLGKPLLVADLLGCLPPMGAHFPQRQVAAS